MVLACRRRPSRGGVTKKEGGELAKRSPSGVLCAGNLMPRRKADDGYH
ncbi:hypothetical protein RK21_02310 [Pseudomonas plecoglossicida]|nr:hypothetical protein RK21_02310 [Pseudomonas plecoglossicida]